MARRNGVDVEEFGIGFPPKAMTLGRDKKRTEYTLNWLPLGGFVRLKGEHDSDTQKGSFGAASFGAKTKIILAGVVMNLLTAWLMFSALAFIGIPRLPLPDGSEQFTVKSDTKVVSNKVMVGYVEPNGPADKAGLKTGDQIVSMFGTFNLECMPPGPCEEVASSVRRVNK
jgi:regulator of sigma E protease